MMKRQGGGKRNKLLKDTNSKKHGTKSILKWDKLSCSDDLYWDALVSLFDI